MIHKTSPALNRALWVIQGSLAALFLFAGGTKLVLPVEEMTKDMTLPGPFLRFVGVAEILGGLGLILPGLLRIREGLTPLAAYGLIIVMAGAVFVSVQSMGLASGILPLATGLLLVLVAYGRRGTQATSRTGIDLTDLRSTNR
jgi:hypothetical protein